jgi:centromere protein J
MSGKKEIRFPNGVLRESWPDGYMVIHFENKDVRQQWPCGKMVYFFFEQGITQTLLSNGDKILLFKSGQLEKHFKD